MRLSMLPECSRALMHASMIACVISSTWSDGMPSSLARLPAARAAAISMSGTIGSVSSICRSAVAVICESSHAARRLKLKEQGGGRLDPARDSSEAVERKECHCVQGEKRRQDISCGERCFEPGAAGLRDVVHGCPPHWSRPHLSNATATREGPARILLNP